jgi:hypothetical protein
VAFLLILSVLLAGFGINLGNVCEKIEDTTGVAPFIIVPGDKLVEVLVERNTGLGIEDGGVVVAVEIGGDDLVLSVCKNT